MARQRARKSSERGRTGSQPGLGDLKPFPPIFHSYSITLSGARVPSFVHHLHSPPRLELTGVKSYYARSCGLM